MGQGPTAQVGRPSLVLLAAPDVIRPGAGTRSQSRRHKLPISSRWPRSKEADAMPEAVVVATARSPIGRAFKGSMTSIRPDDLTAQIITAALAKVPQLDPGDIDDLLLGCGLPGGEQGFNMARVVAVLLGQDKLPGTTVTRYCSSSLQTTRMAFHAIKAGEADVLISAGVETVSRFANGSSDSWPDTHNARVRQRGDPDPAERRGERGNLARSAGGRQHPRRLHRDGPDRGECGRSSRASAAPSRTSSACVRRTWPRRPSPTVSGSGRSSRSRCPTAAR